MIREILGRIGEKKDGIRDILGGIGFVVWLV
jgi:hypothetical protein